MTKSRRRRLPSVISLGEVRSSRTYYSLLDQLEVYCESIPEHEPWSLEQFFGGTPSDEELDVLGLAYLDWLAFDYQAWEDGRTVLERFADTTSLDAPARAMLKAWQSTRLGLYEATGATGDKTLLQDCFTGAEYAVEADPEVDPFAPGDLVICRVLPVGDVFYLAWDVRTTLSHALPQVREAVQRELLRMQRQSPDAAWDHLFKHRWPVVHDAITTAISAGSAQAMPEWHGPTAGHREPASLSELEKEVAAIIWAFETEDDISYADRTRAMQLWWDAAAILRPASGKAEAWAAGAVYTHLHEILADGVTQAEVAEAFGVSASVVAKRARAIVEALWLVHLDDRYADPLDPRVRFGSPLEPLGVRAVAAAEAPPAPPQPSVSDEVAAQRLLALQPEDVTVLALLGQSALASGNKKEARSYADKARDMYLSRREAAAKNLGGTRTAKANIREGQLRLVELLADLNDHESILALVAGDQPAELEGSILRRAAIAASRAARQSEAMAWLRLALDKGEPVNLVGPFVAALELMSAKRIPVFKLDFQEKLDPLINFGMVPKLNALTRAHLVGAIFYNSAKDAVQAVRAIRDQRDPWAGRLLKHLYRQADLPRTVQAAIEQALGRWT
ncbi:MAG: hypothetical protein K0R39_1899 [Symbiobacteriaceae bacterium]|nr:hypothetical protein [Symbiobacteriaceae bacterium]